jgi:hypothetical protein
MKDTFLNWIKLNYFKGQFSFVTFHEVDVSWEVISRNFQAKMESLNSENSEMLIGVGEESITVNNQNLSGLRYPNQFLYSSSEIALQGRSLTIATNIWISDFFSIFFPIWKVLVFASTVIWLSIFVFHLIRGHFEPSALIFTSILLVFNSVCWLSTFFMKSEALSVERRILNIANGVG